MSKKKYLAKRYVAFLIDYIIHGFTFMIGWAYFVQQEGSPKQASPGKAVMGLIVTDLRDNRVSLKRSLGRRLLWILSPILLISLFMIIFSSKNQGLHDRIAGCLVVAKEAK